MSKTKPRSFRLSEDDEKLLAQIALEHQCDEAEAFRHLLRWYHDGRIPAPIQPSITSIPELSTAIKVLQKLSEALAPVVRNLQVRHLPGETPDRKAAVEKWHAKACEIYLLFDEAVAQMRLVRFGILASKDFNVETLRFSEELLLVICDHVRNQMSDRRANVDQLDDQLRTFNELRRFLHACGIYCARTRLNGRATANNCEPIGKPPHVCSNSSSTK